MALAAKRKGIDDLRYLHTLDALIEKAQAKSSSSRTQRTALAVIAMRKVILESFTFSDRALDRNCRNCGAAGRPFKGSKVKFPIVGGHFRLAVGWDVQAYDRNRRSIAGEIMKLQNVIDTPDKERGF